MFSDEFQTGKYYTLREEWSMINIAICDDTEVERKLVYDEVVKFFSKGNELYCIRQFNQSKALWYEIEDGCSFDIMFLDIEMPELDGIDLTQKIKEVMPAALVIFITSYEKYVYESFKVQPYRFIPKRMIGSMLAQALEDSIEYIKKQTGKIYLAKNQKGIEKIPIKNIVYIWHYGKYAYIEKSDNENIKVRKTLKEIYSELPEEDFEWLDRGCICNLSHIVKIKENYAILSNGEEQQISGERIKDVKDRLRRYVMDMEGI